jgi:hypothetical protein
MPRGQLHGVAISLPIAFLRYIPHVPFQIVFNVRAVDYLATLPIEIADSIEDALDALAVDPSRYGAVEFRTAFLITVAGHDVAWTYSKNKRELIVASIRPIH